MLLSLTLFSKIHHLYSLKKIYELPLLELVMFRLLVETNDETEHDNKIESEAREIM